MEDKNIIISHGITFNPEYDIILYLIRIQFCKMCIMRAYIG